MALSEGAPAGKKSVKNDFEGKEKKKVCLIARKEKASGSTLWPRNK